jgi:hypothetical protein
LRGLAVLRNEAIRRGLQKRTQLLVQAGLWVVLARGQKTKRIGELRARIFLRNEANYGKVAGGKNRPAAHGAAPPPEAHNIRF